MTVEVICGKVEGSCRCLLPPDDHEIHICGVPAVNGEPCGGSWHYDERGFMPDTWPGTGIPVTGNLLEDLGTLLFGGIL